MILDNLLIQIVLRHDLKSNLDCVIIINGVKLKMKGNARHEKNSENGYGRVYETWIGYYY